MRSSCASNRYAIAEGEVDCTCGSLVVVVAVLQIQIAVHAVEALLHHLEPSPVVVSALKDSVDVIYFGTLIQRSDVGYQTVQHLLNLRDPRAQCFYDVNLRPNCYSRRIVQDSLQQADHVKVNEQELVILQDMFGWKGSPTDLALQLMETHELTTLSLTRGEAGSDLFTAAGHFTAPLTRSVNVVDTVGAGDAYAAVLIAGLLQNWQPEQIYGGR